LLVAVFMVSLRAEISMEAFREHRDIIDSTASSPQPSPPEEERE
jgi:hypothetical protein